VFFVDLKPVQCTAFRKGISSMETGATYAQLEDLNERALSLRGYL
jgi:hypothetical protein